MKLKEFIEKYVCKNTLIRIWEHTGGISKVCLTPNPKMEWEILEDKNLCDFDVVGVTDILCEDYYEAVNIVIKK